MRHSVKVGRQTDAARVLKAIRTILRGERAKEQAVDPASGLSGAQLFVLHALSIAPGQSVTELARATNKTHSTVSEVVQGLIGRDLVERSSDSLDARRSTLKLTAGGTACVKRSRRAKGNLMLGLRRLGPEGRRALREALERWLESSG
jgi:DNA-binding MarR family transcriptional regulator